jgi:hypothetical protein
LTSLLARRSCRSFTRWTATTASSLTTA